MVSNISIKAKYNQLSRSARRRGLKFNLRPKDVRVLLEQETCAYSGEPFDRDVKAESMSVERVDPTMGYIRGNVIAVKTKYNVVRSNDITAEQSKTRLSQAKLELTRNQKQLDVLSASQQTTDSQIQKLEVELVKLKRDRNKRTQEMNKLKQNIASKQTFVRDLTITIDGIKRVEEQRNVGFFTKIIHKLFGKRNDAKYIW